ncbi:hypothetical protein NY2A_b639L [Paramecium bursaria Chlorella virus NY2A]|uniref:Uncharacterized protein b639L n=1 Tax=Paramecium bursaria Chlorella virus NY2A TaxID=46021 RepID=A7IXG4_PBCVN|nr:hypothetical protein NY2A_b639L [Paramecium bursaria Chlorella virus NY2A]ABT15038.1 hypothetical protein NY2A_b639L [Paramecium bursaria Chlorella virus NY2A]
MSICQSNRMVTRVLIFVHRLIAAFDSSLLLSPWSDLFLSFVEFIISSSICFMLSIQYLIISFFRAHLKKFNCPIVVEKSFPSQSL